ncbi:RNA recognition motif domain-containing protein [Acaryochloris marina]|uniref:RNA-binding protein n=1 Tax=Acaryochloris marina (strain MBIC 11017) TaxID=329726 RepID=B0C8E8_ACAM1|nr:RNA-binding protein [Acaryochloris marina]ABW30103.1 RNA-binding protein [Acaryochloris marina MBIC11017]BDM78955.1 RNA-binding protein [Acaryochloris marina MBIC10699]
MSIRLYVGNLPKELDRDELAALFTAEVGELTSTKVVTDRKTGKCRGFGFVTVETDEQADQVIAKLNGHMFKDNALKIEKALPKSKEANSQGAGNNAPRRGNKNKSRSYTQAEAAQPDPRWADELEKLKEMLFAQTQS